VTATFRVNGVEVVDTFAEAFPMACCRVIVTAASERWVRAAEAATGYAASVIGCDAEAGVECWIPAMKSSTGRPGAALLFFAFNRDALQKAVVNRVGQCVMTCPTTECYNGLVGDEGKSFRVGGNLRYFGDGWQISKQVDGKRFWRIPTMDGEFACEDVFGTTKGVAGGNFILMGENQRATLSALEAAIDAVRTVPGVIAPFPGGGVRSGSKVGSKYKALKASTNGAFCPTLRGLVPSELPDAANCAFEVVIDGVTLEAVSTSMRAGIDAASRIDGVVRITAGNYGGKLGPHHIRLRELFP
jgi:formylmethanofuran--tetrahydromethanopterin N-formyltransferase